MPYYYRYSYWSEYLEQYQRAQRLEQEKTRLSNQKRELERQLAEKTRAAHVASNQVTTLGSKVRELERQNAKLAGDLAKQREDTRKAGLMFMSAADGYQQVAKKQIMAKAAELEDTRRASLLLMSAADSYQGVAKEQTKAKAEELEETRKAVLVLMRAADAYQQEAKKRIMEKVEELEVLGEKKAATEAWAASLEVELSAALAKNRELEVDHVEVKGENDELRSEVARLVMELGALVEAREQGAKAFDAEKTEIMKELEDLRMKVEEIQAGRDLTKGENDRLQSEVLATEQKTWPL